MRVLCMQTAITVSVRIRVSVRKLGFITRLTVCSASYYTVMHTAIAVCITTFTMTA